MSKTSNQASLADEIDDAVLQELYAWVDQIPLSRPKKNLTRDFSDGVLVAEVIAHYFPRFVELHNYPPATGTSLKKENWHVLNRKVFKKLHFELAEDVIKQIVDSKPFVIERVLLMLRTKIDTILWDKQKEQNEQPEVDQHKQEPTPRQAPAAGTKKVTSQGSRNQGLSGGDMLIQANQQINKTVMSREMVPRIHLEEKIQECLIKDETIQILEAKIRRLEHLLHLKDIRINDLQSKVEGVRPTGVR